MLETPSMLCYHENCGKNASTADNQQERLEVREVNLSMGVESIDYIDDGIPLSREEIEALNRGVAAAFAHAALLENGATYGLNGELIPPKLNTD